MARQSERQMWAAKLTGRSAGLRSVEPSAAIGSRVRGLVLGIDPSLRGMGLAVVLVEGAERMKLVASETLKLSTKYSMTECLGQIAAAVTRVIAAHKLCHVAVEETIYVQNFRTAQILGAARGAAVGVAAMQGLPIYEYSPLRIKQAVVGFGRASKEQMTKQMQTLLQLSEPLPFDEADAAAVAACHAMTWREGPASGE